MMHEPNLNLLDELREKMEHCDNDAEFRELNYRYLEEVYPPFERPTAFSQWVRRCRTTVLCMLGMWRPPQ